MKFRQITSLYRFLFWLLLSCGLIIIDHRSDSLAQVRTVASGFNWAFVHLITLPGDVRHWVESRYPDDSLYQEYKSLQAQVAALQTELQRYDSLIAENRRLSELLAIAEKPGIDMLFAEIVEAELDPFTHRVALNRGVQDGVYLGQPVITPDGVLGQVSGVGIGRSVVTLLTDASHAVPVQIQRNSLHTIVFGSGDTKRVEVPFLSAQADIRKGDVLITSGLGGGFPAGYKVAQVEEIITDANDAFLAITARVYAEMTAAKEVFLLWKQSSDERLNVVGEVDEVDEVVDVDSVGNVVDDESNVINNVVEVGDVVDDASNVTSNVVEVDEVVNAVDDSGDNEVVVSVGNVAGGTNNVDAVGNVADDTSTVTRNVDEFTEVDEVVNPTNNPNNIFEVVDIVEVDADNVASEL